MPALSFANETGASFSKPELTVWLKNHFNLRDAELQEKTEGQTKTQFESDVQWVNWKLKKYRFTQSTSHGRAQITDAGRRLLAEHQGDITEAQLRARYNSSRSRDEITISVLNSNPDDRLEQSSFSNHLSEDTLEDDGEVIPEDLMQKGYRQLQDKLADELMDSISSVSPDRFERLVVELLENMATEKVRRLAAVVTAVSTASSIRTPSV